MCDDVLEKVQNPPPPPKCSRMFLNFVSCFLYRPCVAAWEQQMKKGSASRTSLQEKYVEKFKTLSVSGPSSSSSSRPLAPTLQSPWREEGSRASVVALRSQSTPPIRVGDLVDLNR